MAARTRPDGQTRTPARVMAVLAASALAIGACGSDGGTTAVAEADESTLAVDDGGAESEGASSSSRYEGHPYQFELEAAEARWLASDGVYEVGDQYFDGEFEATYLGVAQVPIDVVNNAFESGVCMVPLFEVTYYDAYDYGANDFSPAVDGVLASGGESGDDSSGVGAKLDAIEAEAKDDQSASEVPFTPSGDLEATNVQAAIIEVRDEADTKLAAKANAAVALSSWGASWAAPA